MAKYAAAEAAALAVDTAIQVHGGNGMTTEYGVATLLGVIAPIMPVGAVVYALVWGGLLLTVRISSVASLVAVASAPLSAAVLNNDELFPLLLGFALLIVWKHRTNIQRLFAGTEPKIGRGTA